MKKIITIGCGILAAAGLVHLSARIVASRLEGKKPCRWIPAENTFSCSPLEAHLEVKTSPEPHGHGIAVWYRATVKNESDDTIGLESEFFGRNHGLSSRIQLGDTRVEISDANGKVRPQTTAHSPAQDVGGFEKDIHPYTLETSTIDALIQKMNPKIVWRFSSILSFVPLAPGEVIATSPTMLAPYRLSLQSVESKDYEGTAIIPEPARIKNPEKLYAAPPAGFRRLDGYQLPRGVYTVRFIIQEKINVERYENPSTPLANALRRTLYLVAGSPSPEFGWMVPLETESNSVRIMVPN